MDRQDSDRRLVFTANLRRNLTLTGGFTRVSENHTRRKMKNLLVVSFKKKKKKNTQRSMDDYFKPCK